MKDLNKIALGELIIFLRNANEEEILEIVSNREYILSLPIQKLNVVFLNLNDDNKKKLLNDFEIFDKIMSIPLNRVKKTIIDLVSDDVKNFIYNSFNLRESVNGKNLLKIHLGNLSVEELTDILDNDNLKEVYKVDVVEYASNKFRIDEYLKVLILNAVNNNKFNSLALFKIENEMELLIYAKFGFLVTTNIRYDKIFINDVELDYEFLRNVNSKHIKSLINLMREKDNNINNNMLFVGIIKLYMVLGLDNSKKVINNFFTYATPASLKRVSYELFKEKRREFRLKNQNKFYYHDMEEDFLKALNSNDLEFFRNFCLDTSDNYVNNLINRTKEDLLYLSKLEKLKKIKEVIDAEIIKREEYYRNIDTTKFYKYYKETSRTLSISCADIYNIFSHVDVPYTLSKDGKLIPDLDINKFLLGNYKKDNDCLLRMVFNKHAFGLNRELYNIINHFEEIKEVISKNKDLSLNSISDVIDISKVFLYNLKPNELDITLETLSKILNSRKYCTEDPNVILERTLRLHVKRKEKVGCAVEQIEGKYEDVKYMIPDFDSEDLLVSGIDTGSCFKEGGKGEGFFEFCLTNPKGLVFYIEYDNVRYVLPATINGNMLNINSIDPVIEDEKIFRKIMSAVEKLSGEIVNNPRNKIELTTITDIHLGKFFPVLNYEKVTFSEYLPLGTDVYCDYNKKDVTNYIVSRKDELIKPKYFDNTDLFYEKRKNPYIMSPSHEYDKERIKIKIDSIAYSSIDYLDIPGLEKMREQYYYQNKDVNDYIYLVGNKDWYIGIRKDRTIDKYVLPYDERALEEYQKYLMLIENNFIEEIPRVFFRK